MGFFRHSSNSLPTDSIPASTTLSARTPLRHFPRITLASIIAGTGFFMYAAVQATPPVEESTHATKPATQNSLNYKLDATSTPVAPTPSETTLDTNVSVVNNAGETPRTSVTVNGQAVTIPQNGSITQTTNDGDSQTTLEINSVSQGSASNNTVTSLNVNVSSSSNSVEDNSP